MLSLCSRCSCSRHRRLWVCGRGIHRRVGGGCARVDRVRRVPGPGGRSRCGCSHSSLYVPNWPSRTVVVVTGEASGAVVCTAPEVVDRVLAGATGFPVLGGGPGGGALPRDSDRTGPTVQISPDRGRSESTRSIRRRNSTTRSTRYRSSRSIRGRRRETSRSEGLTLRLERKRGRTGFDTGPLASEEGLTQTGERGATQVEIRGCRRCSGEVHARSSRGPEPARQRSGECWNRLARTDCGGAARPFSTRRDDVATAPRHEGHCCGDRWKAPNRRQATKTNGVNRVRWHPFWRSDPRRWIGSDAGNRLEYSLLCASRLQHDTRLPSARFISDVYRSENCARSVRRDNNPTSRRR